MARRPSIWKTNPEYARTRKNLQNQLSRYRKRGIELAIKVPEIPKKITEASVRALQKKKTQATKQYEKAKAKQPTIIRAKPVEPPPRPDVTVPDFTEEQGYDYDTFLEEEPLSPADRYVEEEIPGGSAIVDMTTGEIVQAYTADRPASPNEAMADHILDVYVYSQFFGNWSPNKSALEGFFNQLVGDYGKETVAKALTDAQKDGVEIQRNVLYDDAAAEYYMSSILDYIDEVGEDTRDQYAEMYANFEDWNTELDREAFESRYME